MTIDQRTRRDGEVPVVDAPTFLDETLPGLARSRSALVALASGLDLRPMTVEVDDRSWTLTRPQPDVIEIESGGDPAKLRLRLTPDQLASNLGALSVVESAASFEEALGLAESPEEYWSTRSGLPWN